MESSLKAEINDSPVEQVRLLVPIADDPTLPVLTIRTWMLGLPTCIILSALGQIFAYQQSPLYVSPVIAQILLLPVGRLMARKLPTKMIRVPWTPWGFSLNPGPFNVKEHVLISMLVSFGGESTFGLEVVTAMKAFYHRDIDLWAAFLMTLSSQLMGYGFAGVCMKFLVDVSNMWWPTSLLDVTFYRALHEKDVRSKGKLTRLQFFFIVCTSSCAYHIFPTYLFPSITTLSFVCWIWKDSVTAQQIGSGRHGLGIGSFGLDWLTATSFLGSPLALPTYSLINSMAGFILLLYIIVPIAYWTNTYKGKLFPIISPNLFDMNGNVYNVSRVLDRENFQFDQQGYDNYSQIYFSTTFAFSTALLFAGLSASFAHIALFHGRAFWRQFVEAKNEHTSDVHNRLMKKYEKIPQYWFYTITVLTIGLAIFSSQGFGRQLQLPILGLLVAFFVGFILILPLGGIYATTGLMPRTGLLSEFITGYLYTGKPLANMTFLTYAITSKIHAIGFLSSFKVGHYMKIPPKSMFIVQIAGTLVSSSATFATGWWLLTNIENICHKELLPKGSPWTCPGHNVFYNYSIVWGVIGPRRVFGLHSVYPQLYVFMVIGIVATFIVWVFSCIFPKKKWIRLINMPNIFSGGTRIPPAAAVNYWSWLAVGIFFNFYVFNKFRDWWTRYSYLLSSGLDAGIAFMGLLVYLALQKQDIYGVSWWGLELDDHCPLANCPTGPGVVVAGCPVFS